MAFFLLGVFTFLATVFNGWVLKMLWNWFIPAIFGLPPLGIVQSLAISLVGSSFLPSKKETGEGVWENLGILCAPLFTLAFGFILRFFI